MSDLRIRSEAFHDEPVIDSFIPSPSVAAGTSAADLGPLVTAASAALQALLGVRVQLLPATETEAEEIEGRGGLALAALLLTLRLGGNPKRAQVPGGPGEVGDVLAAYHQQCLAALDAAVADPELWPRGLETLAVTASAAGTEDGFWLSLPADRAAPRRQLSLPHPRMVAGIGDLPMRLSVELAVADVALLALLPLRRDQIIPISPAADMALRMDGHPIGRVSLSSRPDGRQEALLLALDLSRKDKDA